MRHPKSLSLLVIVFTLCNTIFAQQSISLVFPASLLDTSITSLAIKDVQQLLTQACNCEVSLNNESADVLLRLPAVKKGGAAQLNRFAAEAKFPYRNYPEHNYNWQLMKGNAKIVFELTATSWQGVSFGLYGLLQEKLGFKFYHPRRMIVPHWKEFPLQQAFNWEAKALFDKKGFHLHTEHPLELTEQLHDGNLPGALHDVKEYIDWLARNGQTYFEFCLLESIDRKVWPAHAKNIVDYCHQRGILAAVDLSLHMIQQKTFQLYVGPAAKQKQVEKSLVWLMQADWDFINMEFSTAEFIGGNKKKKEELRLFIIDWLLRNSHTKLMGRQHVVRHENEMGHQRKDFVWDSASLALDKQRGVLSHTVMFYDMTEPNAPVYENKNQRHQFDFLLQQMKERETWYYPESAYWVTFDNSVPMFLLPYLSARLSDIDTCVKYKVPGHITFSSGWEWGYWLFDWSIARWSWQYTTDGEAQKRFPEMYAHEVLPEKLEKTTFSNILNLQQQYLKDSLLIQWLTAMTIIDEMPLKAFNHEFQPRPQWSYKFLQRKADTAVVQKVAQDILPRLESFANHSFAATFTFNAAASELKEEGTSIKEYISIGDEFANSMAVTALRAQHRHATLSYILCSRNASLSHQPCNCDSLLTRAASVRNTALKLVKQNEANYRYPVELIARKRWDHTSYHTGYLYTVSNLYFWQREEEQARRNRYSPFFMGIWNMFRIAGLIN